jgi:hypothetical protein
LTTLLNRIPCKRLFLRSRTNRATVLVVAVCASLQLLSCDLGVPHSEEITFKSITFIESIESLQDPDKSYFRRFTPLLMIEISTKADFGKLAKQGWNITNNVSECSDHSINTKAMFQGFLTVYDKFGLIYAFRLSGQSRVGHDLDQPITYRIYIRLTQTPTAAQAAGNLAGLFRPYDLFAHPANVCLRIAGLNEGIPILSELVPIEFSSNVIVISKATISAAIRRLRSRHTK